MSNPSTPRRQAPPHARSVPRRQPVTSKGQRAGALPARRPIDEGTGDRDDLEASIPPLPGKLHPPREMRFVVPSADDEHAPHHHPSEGGVADFEVNPDAADAARDLAGDLGAQFLEGATFGEDVSERALQNDYANEAELPFLVDQERRILVEDEEEAPPARPRAPARPARAGRRTKTKGPHAK